jgi:hypothetical protein
MNDNVQKLLESRFDKKSVVERINSDETFFREVLQLALKNKQPAGWRSAWLLKHSLGRNDARIRKKVNNIIEAIPKVEDGHQRELMLVLEKMDLDEDQEGHVFDISISLWESINKPSSVRIQGLKFILKTIRKYPELKNEVEFLFDPIYSENLTPGMMNMYQRFMKGAR